MSNMAMAATAIVVTQRQEIVRLRAEVKRLTEELEIERRNQIIADLISGISGACMKMKSPKMGNGHVNDAYEELKMSQRRAISRMNDLEALNGGKK